MPRFVLHWGYCLLSIHGIPISTPIHREVIGTTPFAPPKASVDGSVCLCGGHKRLLLLWASEFNLDTHLGELADEQIFTAWVFDALTVIDLNEDILYRCANVTIANLAE